MARPIALAALLLLAACGGPSPVAGSWEVEFGDSVMGRWKGTMTLSVSGRQVSGQASVASVHAQYAPNLYATTGTTDGSALLIHWAWQGLDPTQIFAVVLDDRLDGFITGSGLSGLPFTARRK